MNESYLVFIVAPLISVAVLVAEHYFPWRRVIGRELPRPAAYMMGVIAVAGPVVVFFPNDPALGVLWLCIILGGLAVIGCYLLDGYIDGRDERERANKLEAKFRDENDGE